MRVTLEYFQEQANEQASTGNQLGEKEVQVLKESNDRLKNENQVLWADVSKLESQLESMRVTLEYFQEQGNEQASTGNQLGEKEVQVLKESNDRLKNENQVLWADVSKLESQLESMRVTLEYFQEQANEQASTGNQLGEKEVQVLKESNDRLKNENQILWADVSKLESQLESMRVTLEYFQEQANEQASTGNQMGEKEVQVLKESNDRLKNENQVLWADVSKLESQLESMRVTLEYFQEQANEQASTGNQLGEKEVQVLKESNDRLKNENQVLWADVSKLESQLESMRVTLEYFQEQGNEQRETTRALHDPADTAFTLNQYTADMGCAEIPDACTDDEERESENESVIHSYPHYPHDDNSSVGEEAEKEKKATDFRESISNQSAQTSLVSRGDENDPLSVASLLRTGFPFKRDSKSMSLLRKSSNSCLVPIGGDISGNPKKSKKSPKKLSKFFLTPSEQTVKNCPAFEHFSPLPTLQPVSKSRKQDVGSN
ncbi:golgin subfamily A member 6-like protein 1 [Rhopilema esculentum]|uniref:golgin subfamily A member 6-like protein 1 n=1 Tax=Rhopilema esculentum TaxID=499914 RepID=UPI0031D71048|eukprot:gene9627-17386_t